jgi:hypothetical protein
VPWPEGTRLHNRKGEKEIRTKGRMRKAGENQKQIKAKKYEPDDDSSRAVDKQDRTRT